MPSDKSTYALLKNQDGTHTCVRSSLCSFDNNGNPVPYCDKDENKDKEACYHQKKTMTNVKLEGCFNNSGCKSGYQAPSSTPGIASPKKKKFCIVS